MNEFVKEKVVSTKVRMETHGLLSVIKQRTGGTYKSILKNSLSDEIKRFSKSLDVEEDPYEIFEDDKEQQKFFNGIRNIIKSYTNNNYHLSGVCLVRLSASKYRVYAGVFIKGEKEDERFTFKKKGKYISRGINDYMTNFFMEGDVPLTGFIPIRPSKHIESGEISMGYVPRIQKEVQENNNELIFIVHEPAHHIKIG